MTKSSITVSSFGDLRPCCALRVRTDFRRREEHREPGKRVRRRIRPLPSQNVHPLTHELAVKRANTDGEPRIVAHAGTLSIVTPGGEIWQVFDSDGPNKGMRPCPLSDDRVWARVFIRADDDTAARIYKFGPGESRSTGPWPLLAQLAYAKSGELVS